MERREAYKLENNETFTLFYFTSIGPKGEIKKVIEFKEIREGLWNLGFGDVNKGALDDKVASDNKDMRKVIQTVVNAVHSFSSQYPFRNIVIMPVDRRRKLLYNRLFREKTDEINLFFDVRGVKDSDNEWENYKKENMYKLFVLYPQNLTFEK